MRKKYVIRPGLTQDENGNAYQIDANTLVHLYQVNESECEVLLNNDRRFNGLLVHYISQGYIFLHPRSDNNYSWIHGKKKVIN